MHILGLELEAPAGLVESPKTPETREDAKNLQNLPHRVEPLTKKNTKMVNGAHTLRTDIFLPSKDLLSAPSFETLPSKNPSKNLVFTETENPLQAPSKNPSKKHLLLKNLLTTLPRNLLLYAKRPAAILFLSRDTCSASIAKHFRACFHGVSYNYRAIRCTMGYRTDLPV